MAETMHHIGINKTSPTHHIVSEVIANKAIHCSSHDRAATILLAGRNRPVAEAAN
jgi:hypothetical protein